MNAIYRAIILLLVFAAVFAVTFALLQVFLNRKSMERFSALNSNREQFDQPWWRKIIQYFTNDILLRLVKYSSPKEGAHDEYKKKFITAGLKGNDWISQYLGLKTFGAVLVPITYIIFISFSSTTSALEASTVAVILAAVGYYLPNYLLSSRIKRRKEELFAVFPDALDLIRVCVAAGMGLDGAIARVGQEIAVASKAMSQEFIQLNLELRAGVTRSIALQNLAIRTDLDEVKALVAMLIQAERYGTSVTKALQTFSDDLRAKRRLQAQETAAKIPVKLSIPIVFCIFPAIFIVLLAPAAMSFTRALG